MKYVYFFGDGTADGSADMKELLGGKGANIAEMTNLGIPSLPASPSLRTYVPTFNEHDKQYPSELEKQVTDALQQTETVMGRKFGDPADPLLISVRSGAAVSMAGHE